MTYYDTKLIVEMEDLLKQATTEKSHYYVGKVLVDAIQEIRRLAGIVEKLVSAREAI